MKVVKQIKPGPIKVEAQFSCFRKLVYKYQHLLVHGEKVVIAGDKAPDFFLPSNKDRKIVLSEFFGKKNVVLFFYPMDESPVCSREVEAFKDAYEDFKVLNAEIIGVSSQSVESHKSFASKHNLPFLLLSDYKGNVRRLYGVSSTFGVPGRVTFVIDKEGVVVFEYSSQLHPARHAQEALSALKKVSAKGN